MSIRTRCTAALAAAALGAFGTSAMAQQADTAAARALLRDSARAWGEAIFPGFRADTIAVVFAMPGGSAASTSLERDGRIVAQVVVGSGDVASLAALAMHESFHAWQNSQRRGDRRFGRQENAYYLSQYPVFSAANEAAFALEGRLLHEALHARTVGDARTAARRFVAVREARHRRIGPNIAEFETQAEMNEGLAEYAQVRTHGFLGQDPRTVDALPELANLTGNTRRSIRLRFYATGGAQALLLDRLAGPGWQRAMLEDNLSLHEMLARATGLHDTEMALARDAARAHDMPALQAAAVHHVAALKAERQRLADSLLARAGVTVVLDGSLLRGSIGQCGFDPQNMLAVDTVRALHTRWLRVCGGGYDGEFTTAVLVDGGRGTMTAVVGAAGSLRLTAGGNAVSDGEHADVRLESPGLVIRFARAAVLRDGARIVIRPR